MSTIGDLLRRTLVRLGRIIAFVLYFSYEFIVSNLLVLQEIYRWRPRAAPALLEIRLRCRTPLEIVSLGNLVGLTPGTLTIEVSQEPPTLYVHGMFARDPAAFRRQLARLEDYLLGALRPVASEPGRRYRGGSAGAGVAPEVERR